MRNSDSEKTDWGLFLRIWGAMFVLFGTIALSVVLALHGVSMWVIFGVLTLGSLVMTWATGGTPPMP